MLPVNSPTKKPVVLTTRAASLSGTPYPTLLKVPNWPNPEALTRRTGFLLSMTGMLSRGELARALEPMGIKPRGYGVLVVLTEEGPAPQQTVGERIGIDKSTMVVVVDELEELGLV
jgi:hypothetical protein